MPEETSSRSVARDLPHDEQITRAQQVDDLVSKGTTVTQAAEEVAKDANVKLRTIWRAKRYQDAFQRLPEEFRDTLRKYVNTKKVSVGYVERLATLDQDQQRKFFQDCDMGNFPKRGSTTRIRRPSDNTDVPVTVPEDETCESEGGRAQQEAEPEPIRKSYHIQAVIAKCGEKMGFKIWLPKHDRGAVLQEWQPKPGSLIDVLPLSYNATALRTIEEIDVLWLKNRSGIVHAFEVEHTTVIYSGILRMADMLALLPGLHVKLHIVAPTSRRKKVLDEIARPIFSLLEPVALSEICTYLSYDAVEELFGSSDLAYMKDGILEKYAEYAEEETD